MMAATDDNSDDGCTFDTVVKNSWYESLEKKVPVVVENDGHGSEVQLGLVRGSYKWYAADPR